LLAIYFRLANFYITWAEIFTLKITCLASFAVLHFHRIPRRHVNRSGFIKPRMRQRERTINSGKKANHVRPSFRANYPHACVFQGTKRYDLPFRVFMRQKCVVLEFSRFLVENSMIFHFSIFSHRALALFSMIYLVEHCEPYEVWRDQKIGWLYSWRWSVISYMLLKCHTNLELKMKLYILGREKIFSATYFFKNLRKLVQV